MPTRHTYDELDASVKAKVQTTYCHGSKCTNIRRNWLYFSKIWPNRLYFEMVDRAGYSSWLKFLICLNYRDADLVPQNFWLCWKACFELLRRKGTSRWLNSRRIKSLNDGKSRRKSWKEWFWRRRYPFWAGSGGLRVQVLVNVRWRLIQTSRGGVLAFQSFHSLKPVDESPPYDSSRTLW